MKYKILFINAIPPGDRLQNAYPSLGIGHIISYLKSRIGDFINISVINSNRIAYLKKFRPDIVCLSSVTQNYSLAKEIASEIKKEFPSLPIILGGVHISCLPQSLSSDFNVAVIGEGEEAFADLAQQFLGQIKNPPRLGDIKGIVFWQDGKLVSTAKREMVSLLDSLPHPERKMLPGSENQLLLTSRGCPYRCAFCASGAFWKGIRYFSPGYILEEIMRIVGCYPVLNLTIYDDLFVFNKKRLAEISDLIIKNGMHKKINFWCNARANHIDEETMGYLKRMNVKGVGIGFESGSGRVLKRIKSDNVSVEINQKAINICKKNGIFVHGSFILGCPDETEEEMLETFRFIRDCGIDKGEISVATPLPGTNFWEYALQKGLVYQDMDWSRLAIHYTDNYPAKNEFILLSRQVSEKAFLNIFGLIVSELKKKLSLYEKEWGKSQGSLIKMNNLISIAYFKKFFKNPRRGLNYVKAYLLNKLYGAGK